MQILVLDTVTLSDEENNSVDTQKEPLYYGAHVHITIILNYIFISECILTLYIYALQYDLAADFKIGFMFGISVYVL